MLQEAHSRPGGMCPTDVAYPNGRKSFRDYGSANSLSDKISRLAAIRDDGAKR